MWVVVAVYLNRASSLIDTVLCPWHQGTIIHIFMLWSDVSISISFLACNGTQIYECLCRVPSYATIHYLPTVDAYY